MGALFISFIKDNMASKYIIISEESIEKLQIVVDAFIVGNPTFQATGEAFFISPTVGYSQVLTVPAIAGGGGGSDNELRVTSYKAIANGVGYSLGDFISRTDIIAVPAGTIVATLWFNETTGLTIAVPPIADLAVVMPATAVTVNNLPVVLGQAPMAASLAVVIASDQSAIPITSTSLDVLLSTRNAEATQ